VTLFCRNGATSSEVSIVAENIFSSGDKESPRKNDKDDNMKQNNKSSAINEKIKPQHIVIAVFYCFGSQSWARQHI
jgi:hypothetical protein